MSFSYSYDAVGLHLNHSMDDSPSDSQFSLHVHDDYELLCVVSGKVGYIVEGRVYDLRPGSLMLMRSAETHRLLVNQSERYERYIINFRPELLEAHGFSKEILMAYNDRNLGELNLYHPSDFSGMEPVGLFRQMCEGCELFSPESVLIAHLATLLYAINTVFQKRPLTLQNSAVETDAGKELIDFINENLLEDLSLESISREIHMSPSQMNRVFHKVTGTSVYHYILSKRLIVAQEMLAKGESAMDVSQSCGFHDYSSFYRLYKKRFGISPNAARKKIELVGE